MGEKRSNSEKQYKHIPLHKPIVFNIMSSQDKHFMGVRSQALTTKVPILRLVILFKPRRGLWDVFDRSVEEVFSVGPNNCSSWNEPLSLIDFVQKGADAITCNVVVVW